eukprot:2778794-Prymnesium_polylepis.1
MYHHPSACVRAHRGAGEVPPTPNRPPVHHPPPQGGDVESACGALVWGSAAFRGFLRGGPRLF